MTGGKAYQWGDPGKGPGFAGAAPTPEWLLDLCLEGADAAPSQRDQTASADQTPPSAAAAAVLEQECNTVAAAPEGTRNDTLNKAAFKLGQSIAMGELDRGMVERYLTAACVKNGLISPKGNGLREVNQTVKSGIEAGLREQQSAQHVFGTHPDEWQDSYAYIEPLKANNASRVSTPSSRLGGSGGLLAEQRVGGLPLRIRQACIEAVESGRQALGVVGVSARDLSVGVHVVDRAHRGHGVGPLSEERIRARGIFAHRLAQPTVRPQAAQQLRLGGAGPSAPIG
jgi:hypothetical protein